jgi:CheY-like chemotaxis protein
MATILLVDDEESVRMVFQVALERARYRVLTAESGQQACVSCSTRRWI